MTTHERELTHGPVDLCRSDGTLAPEAVGWSRRPVHRANLRGWGRTKRWEYWCVTTPTHLVALTVSDLDFLRLDAVYVLELGAGGREIERTALRPGGRLVFSTLAHHVGGAPARPEVTATEIPARTPDGGVAPMRRRVLTASVWANALEWAGFAGVRADVLPAAGDRERAVGTLLVRAFRPAG